MVNSQVPQGVGFEVIGFDDVPYRIELVENDLKLATAEQIHELTQLAADQRQVVAFLASHAAEPFMDKDTAVAFEGQLSRFTTAAFGSGALRRWFNERAGHTLWRRNGKQNTFGQRVPAAPLTEASTFGGTEPTVAAIPPTAAPVEPLAAADESGPAGPLASNKRHRDRSSGTAPTRAMRPPDVRSWELQTTENCLVVNGRPIALQPIATAMLSILQTANGEPVRVASLAEQLHGVSTTIEQDPNHKRYAFQWVYDAVDVLNYLAPVVVVHNADGLNQRTPNISYSFNARGDYGNILKVQGWRPPSRWLNAERIATILANERDVASLLTRLAKLPQ